MRPHVNVARLDGGADLLRAGPAVRAVAAGARWTTLLHGPDGRATAALLPGVDALEEFDAPWFDAAPRPVDGPAVRALVRRLASLNIDEAVILSSPGQSPLPLALLLRMAGIPRIGAISEDEAGSLLDLAHRAEPGLHEVERNLSAVAALGYQPGPQDGGRLAIRRGGGPPRSVGRLGPFVAVHPAPVGACSEWDHDDWRALVSTLLERGRTVVITGDAAAPPIGAGPDRGGRLVELRQSGDLAGLAEVLAAADAVVCDADLPAQLAAAVEAPVVWLPGRLPDAERRRPWRTAHALLAAPTVDEVVAGIERLTAGETEVAAEAS